MRNKLAEKLLWLSCILLLMGRGLEHFFWDAPYRELLWKESFVQPILNLFHISWRQWSYSSDHHIRLFTKLLGTGYIAAAVFLIFQKKFNKLKILVLTISSGGLLFYSYLFYLSKLSANGAFIEMTLQWAPPLILMFFYGNKKSPVFYLLIKLCLVAVFVGHGLFAIGYYQVPAQFSTMVQRLTPLNEYSSIVIFLKMAGILDILASFGIFWSKSEKICLWYMAIWGALTALARPLSFIDPSILILSLREWIPAFLVRLPHCLIPLFLIIEIGHAKRQKAALP